MPLLELWNMGGSEGARGSQSALASLGIGGRLVVPSGKGVQRRLQLVAVQSPGARGCLGLGQSLHCGVTGRLAVVGDVGRPVFARGHVALRDAGPPPLFVDAVARVWLDGGEITSAVTSVTIRMDQDALYPDAEVLVADPALGPRLDPAISRGSPRLRVQMGDYAGSFLLERRDAGPESATIWGRGAAAALATPFSPPARVSSCGALLASQAAAAMVPACRFNLEDWVLPLGWSHNGDALDGLRGLAEVAGGVATSGLDGIPLVRPRWPGGVAAMRQGAPAWRLHGDVLLELRITMETGEWVDQVEVRGAGAVDASPMIEVEGEPARGDDVYVRCYQGTALAPWVSSGTVLSLGRVTETVSETVAVLEGAATVSRPVHGPVRATWEGSDGGVLRAGEEGSREIRAAAGVHGVATLTYPTQYERFLCRGHDVDALLLVFAGAPVGGVRVLVQSAGLSGRDRVADPIEDGLVTSDRIAILRGGAWLLDNAYDRRVITVDVPWMPMAPGDLVDVSYSPLRLSGLAWARAVTWRAEAGGRMWTEAELVQPVVAAV